MSTPGLHWGSTREGESDWQVARTRTGEPLFRHHHEADWHPAYAQSNSDGFRWLLCFACEAETLLDRDSPDLARMMDADPEWRPLGETASEWASATVDGLTVYAHGHSGHWWRAGDVFDSGGRPHSFECPCGQSLLLSADGSPIPA
jgi:hypothetical protein